MDLRQQNRFEADPRLRSHAACHVCARERRGCLELYEDRDIAQADLSGLEGCDDEVSNTSPLDPLKAVDQTPTRSFPAEGDSMMCCKQTASMSLEVFPVQCIPEEQVQCGTVINRQEKSTGVKIWCWHREHAT